MPNNFPILVKSGGVSRTTAKLMKTGQTTSYRTGDDGDIEAGRGVDFFTLAENNPFGNTNRFTDELGGQNYTNNIVIDWSTYDGVSVLGYYIGSSGKNRTLQDAIDWGVALSVDSFTSGWRLLNIKELYNIFNYEYAYFINYAPFNLGNINMWTSNLTEANRAVAKTGQTIAHSAFGGNTYRTVATRDFAVNGTTLT